MKVVSLLILRSVRLRSPHACACRWVRVRKGGFQATALIGAAYGSVFELAANRTGRGANALVPVPDGALVPAIHLDLGSGTDNRALVDTSEAQSLDASDIARMRTEGADGGTIIAALAGGSATFASKTAFSQEKWLRKKALKYLPRLRIVRTTPLNVCETALLKHPEKIAGLRPDSLARMLMAGDVRAGARPLVFDGVAGLLLAAAAHRMGGAGMLLAAHADGPGGPPLSYFTKLNFRCAAGAAAATGGDGASTAAGALVSAPAADGEPASAVPAGAGPEPRVPLCVVGLQYRQLTSIARDVGTIAARLDQEAAAACAAAMIPASPVPIDTVLTTAEGNSAGGTATQVDVDAADTTEVPATVLIPITSSDAAVSVDTAIDTEAAISAVSTSAMEEGAAAAETQVLDTQSIDVSAASTIDVTAAVVAPLTSTGITTTSAAPPSRKRGRGRVPGAGLAQRPVNPHIMRPARTTDGAREALLLQGADCLLIAVPTDPLPLLMVGARFIRPSSAIAVYCQEAEPLIRCARALRSTGMAVHVDVSETWTREYQVLPDRTHPTMSMHAASGFLLTATSVSSKYSCVLRAIDETR